MDDDGSLPFHYLTNVFLRLMKSNIISLSFHCYQCLLSNVYQCLLFNVCQCLHSSVYQNVCFSMFANVCFPMLTKMFTSKPFSRWSLIDSCGVKRHWEEVFSSGTSHFLMMRLWILMTHDLSVFINFPIG